MKHTGRGCGGYWCVMPLDQSQNGETEWKESSHSPVNSRLYFTGAISVCVVNATLSKCALCVCHNYKKHLNHICPLTADSQQFDCIFQRLMRYVMAHTQLLNWQEAGVWQALVNTAREWALNDRDPCQLIEVAADHPQLIGAHNPMRMSYVVPREERD